MQRQRAELACLDQADEQPDIRLAKGVNRLLRIPDQEQRTAITGLPVGGELAEQANLRFAGVLHFVDQQVTNLGVGAGDGFATTFAAGRGNGSQCHLGEVGLAAAGKLQS